MIEIVILKENFIRLEIFLNCLLAKYSGINLNNVVFRPKIAILDKRIAVLAKVKIKPTWSVSKFLFTKNQNKKEIKVTNE